MVWLINLRCTRYKVTVRNAKNQKTTFTAKRNITLYKTAGGSKVSYIVKKGTSVKITECCEKNGNWYFYINVGKKKSGWIKNPKQNIYYPNVLFKETIFAG